MKMMEEMMMEKEKREIEVEEKVISLCGIEMDVKWKT